jgi:hypothetical protein
MNNYYWPYVSNLWSRSLINNHLDFPIHHYIKTCQPASNETTTQCIYFSLCGKFIQESVRENITARGEVFHITLNSDGDTKTIVGIMGDGETSFTYIQNGRVVSGILNCRTTRELFYFLATTFVISVNYQVISISTSPFSPIDLVHELCVKFNRIEDYNKTMRMVCS